MSSPTRWAGIPLTDRRAERRGLLVAAAYSLFGDAGEAAVSVRSVCRECGLNTRYFYESFPSTDELLGAVYDEVNGQLSQTIEVELAAAGARVRDRTRAGIAAVLRFSCNDPRRGRILFTEARSNAVLVERRAATQTRLFEMAVDEGSRQHPDVDPEMARVGAAMYAGAMIELTQQWLAGTLGTDVDAVVDRAIYLALRG